MSTNASHTHKGSPTNAEVKVDAELSKDKKFHLLKNSRRRAVIALLLEHGSLSKRDLGEMVASREFNRPIDDIPSDERKKVMISLHQTHYDQLESAGVIRCTNDVYYRTPITKTLEQYVDLELNP